MEIINKNNDIIHKKIDLLMNKINTKEVNWMTESTPTITSQLFSNPNFNGRQRSSSRVSRADSQNRSNHKETFASILSTNTSDPSSIRIIQITGDVHSTKEELIKKLYSDDICASIKINSIKNQGNLG